MELNRIIENRVNDEGIKELGKYIALNDTVQFLHLYLSYKYFSVICIKDLLQILKNMIYLQLLRLDTR